MNVLYKGFKVISDAFVKKMYIHIDLFYIQGVLSIGEVFF